MPSIIAAVGGYVPEKVVTNDDLAQQVQTSDEWIYDHTGIRARHIAAKEQSCSDLGFIAATRAFQKSKLIPEDLDLIIVATTTPDYSHFPSTACVLQKRLGAGHCPAFDISAACSGFIYALDIAQSLIATKRYRNALIVGSELLSRLLNWQDRSTCVLFGDGAGAVLLEQHDEPGIIDTLLYADGQLEEVLCVPNSGTKDCGDALRYLKMDGRKVYNFAVSTIQKLIKQMLQRNHLTWKDLRFIVPHQANLRIIQAVAKREDIPLDKFYVNIARYANTSSASIPLALHQMQDSGLLTAGDLILLIGFGAGVTWGASLIRWSS